MGGTFTYQLSACGKNGLPATVTLGPDTYHLKKVLKHDFFAATALYESHASPSSGEKPRPTKIILKLERRQHFLGLPLSWLGELLCCHEVSILRRLRNLNSMPRFLARYGQTGFAYEYIEGHSLKEQKELPPDFFDELHRLLEQVHKCNVVYLDMDKRSNILLGADGKPYLIDFQISLHIGDRVLFSRRLAEYVRLILRQADIYHLFKHKRRLCPDLLRPHEATISHRKGTWIRAHRLLATPLRNLRRALLNFLCAKGALPPVQNPASPRENHSDHGTS
jgi:hypothetical protein